MLSDKKKNLEVRSCLIRAVRTFFYDRKYLEVETPVRVENPALEDYIDAESSAEQFLRTSPELHMKQMLAAGYEKIFQIGSCFRKGEFGNRHRPEFTMLEWYRTGADYREILDETQELLKYVSAELGLRTAYFSKKEVLTVNEAFVKFAGAQTESFIADDSFEETLCFKVEPHLGIKHPLFLIDYPSSMAALSKRKADDSTLAERWELYIDGVEIANAYSELTDAKEQRRRFEETQELRRKDGREVYDIDDSFMQALEKGLPECGGIAVGIDRLCMVLTDSDDIADVRAFS